MIYPDLSMDCRVMQGAWTTSTDQLLAAGVADTRK